MALQAEQIHVAHSQHVHVRASMGDVAGRAALDLYGLVLKDVWPLLVRVARKANGILCRGGPHLLWSNGAVWIVTIGAPDQPFVNAMMKRHLELGFLSQVA